MSSETIKNMLNEADKVAYATTTGLPRQDYDAMHTGHCMLTLTMMEATRAHLQSVQWPEKAQAEQANALKLITEAMIAYGNFMERYGLNWDDFHEDYLNSAEGQARVARLEEGQHWANKVFLSLPDLPKG
jgi:hypothetical protein